MCFEFVLPLQIHFSDLWTILDVNYIRENWSFVLTHYIPDYFKKIHTEMGPIII